MNRRPLHLPTASIAVATLSAAVAAAPSSQLSSQSLPAPYHGQHAGVALADLNGDGAIDVLFAAGRHWVDQPYALLNLGPQMDKDGKLAGVRFSEALPVGTPGAYYQIDVASKSAAARVVSNGGGDGSDGGEAVVQSTILLVGGTCHVETPNDFGSCTKGENTPARVLGVRVPRDGCSIHRPDAPCQLEYEQVWEHPDPKGDRNGGFATFDHEMIALLGQGGIELFRPMQSEEGFLHTGYSSVYRHSPPDNTDPRSDYSRYAGFAAGHLPGLGGVVAAGRRTDYDAPQKDDEGNIVGINKLFHEDKGSDGKFQAVTLPASSSGEPYPGDAPRYSLQSTNYAFADIDGDGVQDLLEATFLYAKQRVPDHPLPQRVHFLTAEGGVRETLVVLEEGPTAQGSDAEGEDAGRSVTTGQIFGDSPLPDVVFASAEGVVTLFANLGVDEFNGKFRGLEQRYSLDIGTDICQVRDVEAAPLARDGERCWIGIVCAVTCGVEVSGRNHIFYVEGDGTVCEGKDDGVLLAGESVLEQSIA